MKGLSTPRHPCEAFTILVWGGTHISLTKTKLSTHITEHGREPGWTQHVELWGEPKPKVNNPIMHPTIKYILYHSFKII